MNLLENKEQAKQQDKENSQEDFFLNLEIVPPPKGSTKHALQIRKTISFNEKNQALLKKIVLASLENEYVVITSRVCFRFNDRLKAVSKLTELGLLGKKKE